MDKEMHYHTADLSGVRDRAALHRRLEKALGLPSWYGRNLDALYDVLTDGFAPLQIRFTEWEELQEGDPVYFDRFRTVLSDAEKELPGSSFVFAGGDPEEPEEAGADEEYEETQDPFFRT